MREQCHFRKADKSAKHPSSSSGLRIILVLMLIFAAAVYAHGTMKMTPYLQAVTTNSIYVLVECDSTAPVTAYYGPTIAYGSTATTETTAATTAVPVTYVHRIKLIGLLPNTVYHYRVSQNGVNFSSDYSFITAPLPGTSFRFAWMADCRTGTTVHNTIAGRMKAANPRFSIYGGDLCNDSSYTAFKNEFFLSNELALDAVVPFFNAPGNHEGWTQNTQAFTWAPGSTQAYYSFDYGDVHCVSINNEVSYSVGSAQYNFVSADLAASTKTWKIVFFHQPAYCSGGHNENSGMVTMSINLFVPNGVDLVLTGHSHFYQHNLVNGLNHYVIGSAGAPLYDPTNASYTIMSAKVYEYAIIDVTPTTLHMTVYKDDGTELDKLDLVSCAAAAKAKPDGTIVDITEGSIVTLVPTEAKVFYIQDAAGTSGIRAETNGTKPAVGAKIRIRGTLDTKANGERVILNTTIGTWGTGTTHVRGMNNRAVGGYGYISSETWGLLNQGLLIRVWGVVRKSVIDPILGPVFWVDDGTGVDPVEPDGTLGVKVIESGLTPAVGTFLAIAGVVAADIKDGKMIRVMRYLESLP